MLKRVGTLIHADKRSFLLSNQRKSAFLFVQIKFGVNHIFCVKRG
jgi:hypothetical protein